ncbi:GlsB/YeaQ/YmgE family stress response membrane protein [soil metagenome]
MNILLWIILGGVAGWIASMIMKSDSSQGTLMDIVLGVVGAVVGGYVMNFFGQAGVTGFNIYSLIVATVGAVIVIWIGRMLRRGA